MNVGKDGADSDENIFNEKNEDSEDKKKRYQKKSEDKTSKQDDVRLHYI